MLTLEYLLVAGPGWLCKSLSGIRRLKKSLIYLNTNPESSFRLRPNLE